MLAEITDVRQAIASDTLVPVFQPIVELRTGTVVGFEVLARWQHPQHGLILPENFIALAEQHGLIDQLTRQVAGKAFQAMLAYPEHSNLAVNISPIQLQNLDLANQLKLLATQSGFPTDRIMVEITESALVDDFAKAKHLADQWHAMGCRLALDDFGTGYSSFSHLQAITFDEIKIDRSFTASMLDQRESRKIVASVIGLGHSLGLTTVAEGVETEEQADLLLWLGCDLAQGWFFGRPQPANLIPQMLNAVPRRKFSTDSLPSPKNFAASMEALPAVRLHQLQSIYEGVPVGLCFLDRNLRYVSLNQRYADLDGIPMEDHIGRTPMEVIPEVFAAVEPFLHRALSGEAVYDQEVVRPSPSPEGGQMVTLFTYQPAFDTANQVIGISVAVADITAARNTEQALLSSKDHYQLMVDLNPNVPWLLDSQGDVLDVSKRWIEMTGLSKAQTLKLGWLDALHPDDVKHTVRHLVECVQAQQSMDVEYRVWNVDKGWRWMHARGAPRFGENGAVLYWYGTLEDIDERKLMNQQLVEVSRLQGI